MRSHTPKIDFKFTIWGGGIAGVFLFIVMNASGLGAQTPAGRTKSDEKSAEAARTKVTESEAREALELFKKMSKDDDPTLMVGAIRRLGDVRHKLVAKALAKKLRSNDQQVQIATIQALRLQEPKYAKKPLLSSYYARPNKDRPKVRGAALEALGSLGATNILKVLMDVLEDLEEDPEVVKGAVIASGALEDVRTLEALITILEKDPDDQPETPGARDPPGSYWRQLWKRWRVVEKPCRDAIEKLTGQKFENGKKAREWYDKNKRRLKRKRS